MPRNAEIIRQWRILREIEASHGVTIPHLAELTGVTTRTIRRDLEALQEAGFALYDQTVDGRKRWRLDRHPFKKLDEVGFTLGELSALYFSRTLMECLSGTPFQEDLSQAFAKLDGVLGARTRAFLDRLPDAIQAKPGPAPRVEARQQQAVGRLLDAVLHQQRLSMRYHSMSSQKEKTYRIDPYRLVYAQGGLYLFAYVPEYQQVRTFAVDRIRQLSALEETFEIVEDLGDTAFAHSLGMHEGTPERVEVEFAAEVAPYVTERVWHQSQSVDTAPDGSVVVHFDVCTDASLTSWILGFGAAARVRVPLHLAESVSTELARARQRYDTLDTSLSDPTPRSWS